LLGPPLRQMFDQLFPEPIYVTGNYTALYKQTGKHVVMFSTSTCPYCERARTYLRQANVDYQDFVIDLAPSAKQQFKELGGSRVPVLFIADRRIIGFHEDTIRESLGLIQPGFRVCRATEDASFGSRRHPPLANFTIGGRQGRCLVAPFKNCQGEAMKAMKRAILLAGCALALGLGVSSTASARICCSACDACTSHACQVACMHGCSPSC
jgi:glutaredoxin